MSDDELVEKIEAQVETLNGLLKEAGNAGINIEAEFDIRFEKNTYVQYWQANIREDKSHWSQNAPAPILGDVVQPVSGDKLSDFWDTKADTSYDADTKPINYIAMWGYLN
jgi:hypothetical protein